MSGVKERLGRLTRTAAGAVTESRPEPGKSESTQQEDDRWGALGFAIREGTGGAYLVREAAFRSDFKHGRFCMGELDSVCGALSRLDPSGRSIEAGRLLFLDTETTGLGHGAGNVPFLIGIGSWSEAGFTVRQYLMRHPGEEAAMLMLLGEALGESTHLVTYNGRAFDWPIVKNRYVMNRLPVPPDPAQLDFLYPSRSLWRTTMPSCRLGSVEEGILGVFRHDDVPGSMAPALYFQYLAEGDPSVLSGVVRHNEKDILTLLSLAVHFGRLLNGDVQLERLKTNELNRLGLWYERLGFQDEAERVYETIAARPLDDAYTYLRDAAEFFKKRRQWDRAVSLWKEIVESGRRQRLPALEPYLELAMAYEHRYKNPDEALYWTEEALRSAQTRLSLSRSGTDGGKLRETIGGIQRRRERLLKKQRTLF
ncbi:ribonuclease H-like domain-containing protein [Paenibacillus alkalitolerans]|uniref:ribonuclease H-like domain-containing protein n=1 Tax=Paenibacillus alkalitolerans TaxID=2799335 RepID=UPI0018F76125|nr:ribonuclease H-like domain-containing protein [Paenibacillus alkalitolerans]